MKTNRPTINVDLETRKKKTNGMSPLFIRVSWKGKKAVESAGVEMSEKDYKSGQWKRNKQIKKRIDEIDERIDRLVSSGVEFTPKECFSVVIEKRITPEQILIEMAAVKKLKEHTVINYKTTIWSLKQYFGEDFMLQDLTLPNIQGYARSTNVSASSMMAYLNCLSGLYTYGVGRGYLQHNPMTGWSYTADGYKATDKPKSRSRGEISVITRVFETSNDEYAREAAGIWLSGFYFNGLAFVDLKSVDWKKVEVVKTKSGEYYHIVFRRNKTREVANIMTPVIPVTKKLMKLLQSEPWKKSKYYEINLGRWLKRIFPDLTYYQCRHTFASIMVNSRQPLNTIASMMGRSVNGIATYVSRVSETETLATAADALKRAEILETPPEDLWE